eukprot:TRINITY_DN1336_c0_g1_i2.p1 TRINITY_DN1336_c0_g1~~TRINITY_DN1336_c0_g1_i2.p1  ORF type:complete len:546 (-),score=208.97 TRINITY_DN1336_c0_g1_i2:375-2012(-)
MDDLENPLFDHPMHLCKPDDNHERLEVVPDTLRLLSQIKQPIVLVTVVGTQRGGKSTLLNLLHSRRTQGFGLGHYLDAQTTGLWIWARRHPHDPELVVLCMDTEGLDTPHVPQWYNWCLSALSILVSSYFIYQTKGSIDANAIDRLGVILKVAEQLRGGQQQQASGGSSDRPHFLWLIRDQQLQMKKAPRAEMADKLDSAALKALERCFAEPADCMPLPRPVDRDEQLKDVESMEWEELRSEFREKYAVLEDKIFTSVSEPRRLAGRTIDGSTIAGLLDTYCASIASKDGGLATQLSQLPTQRQMVVRLAGERAVQQAVAAYRATLHEALPTLPVDQAQLAAAHLQAHTEALGVFRREAMLDSEADIDSDNLPFFEAFNKQVAEWSVQATPLELGTGGSSEAASASSSSAASMPAISCAELRTLVGGHLRTVWDANLKLSTERCQAELDRLFAAVLSRRDAGEFGSVDELRAELRRLQCAYADSAQASGPAKQPLGHRFFAEHTSLEPSLLAVSLSRRDLTSQALPALPRTPPLSSALPRTPEGT